MHIIFKNHAAELEEKYTVLDLDTFKFPDGTVHTACCVIENMPIQELAQAKQVKDLHANLISEYGKRNWNYCEQAIDQLLGKWGGEVDSFYEDLQKRITYFQEIDLDESWTPVISKT
jgi:hypothetical protein